MTPSLLLLADSRLPTGGHVHSAGVEAALARGDLATPDEVAAFLAARVPVAGLVGAAAAAAAVVLAGREASDWEAWEAAVSARIPVAALREVSRAQGRAWRRTAAATWPSPRYDELGRRPHQALVLGVAVAAAGGAPGDAAALAVHHLVGQVATAAVRLAAHDPLALAAVHARALDAAADVIDEAARAGVAAVEADDPGLLPTAGAPLPDVLATVHAHRDGTLFVS